MNRKIFNILLIALTFQSCLQKNESNTNTYLKADKVTKEIKKQISYDSNPTVENDNLKYTCDCNWVAEKMNHITDLSFSNNGKAFSLDSLTRWSDSTAKLKIKSLTLKDFDTIPSEMAIFENVESVYLEAINNKNVQGLEVFPKLRILKAEAERFDFNKEPKWIKKIEVIHANKTKFSGLKSFSQMPRLREVRLSFSGFDVFPIDFDSLKCLSYFETGAHTFCDIDLAKLNFTELNCLKYVEFQSWRENLNSIPIGIEKIKTVKISHPNLTHKEKEKLNKTSG